MRPSNNTGATRTPASTRMAAAPGAASRTPAGTRVRGSGTAVSSTGPSRGTPGRGVGVRRSTALTSSSSSTTAAAAPTPSSLSALPRRAPARTSRDAIQAEMDALADDFYGGVATVAPARPPHQLPPLQSPARSGVYSKADVRSSVTPDILRRQTTWFDGPMNPAGRSFDASDSNLLCMDVLAPPGPAAGTSQASLCVVGSADHGLKVFDLTSMRELKSLYTKTCGHTEWVTSCRFLSDRRVLSGGMDAKLCLWADVSRGGPARCVDLLGHTGSISQVDVNERDGRAIALSASYDRTIRIWELSAGAGGRQVGCLSGHKGPVTQFSWCESHVLSGDRQGTVKLWDVETAQCTLTASSKRGQIGALGHLVHSDVGHLVMFGDQGGVLTVLDARAPPKTKPAFQEALHPGGMVTFVRSPAQSAVAAPLIVSCGADKRVVARDARRNFEEVYVMADHDDFVYSMDIFGNLLLTGAGNGRVLVHNVETGELLYELNGNAAAVREMFASPGRLVTSGDDGKAKVFDFM